MLPAQGKSSLNDSCCRHRHQAAEFLNFFLNHYPKLFLNKCWRRRRRRKKKNKTKDVLVWIWRLRFNSLPARRDSTSPPPTCWRTFQFHHFVPNLQSSTDEEELNSISSNETRWIELNQFFLTITLLEALSLFSITLSLPLSILSLFFSLSKHFLSFNLVVYQLLNTSIILFFHSTTQWQHLYKPINSSSLYFPISETNRIYTEQAEVNQKKFQKIYWLHLIRSLALALWYIRTLASIRFQVFQPRHPERD